MRTNDIIETLKEYKQFVESNRYTVAYIALYGSQNYGLDLYTKDYQSDLDAKAVVVPTLDDLVYNSKPVSKVLEYKGNQIDVKDIRSYTDTLIKANPAYLETLFTKYYIIDDRFKNEMESILNLKDGLVNCLSCQFIRAAYGMMCEKEKAFSHPYPATIDKIEKYGYDPKQLHHIVRLWYLIEVYIHEKKYVLRPQEANIQFLLDIKQGKFSFDEAVKQRDYYMSLGKNAKDEYLSKIDENKIDYSAKYKVVDLSRQIIKQKIIDEVLNNHV